MNEDKDSFPPFLYLGRVERLQQRFTLTRVRLCPTLVF